MCYIVCDGDNYLKQNKSGFSVTTNINEATRWTKINAAKNVCRDMNQGKKLGTYEWETKFVTQENKIIYPPAKPIELSYEILDKVREFSEFASQLEERNSYLKSMLSQVDLEIVDIEHAAEFFELNAAQGYKLYKLLHETRKRRREIKKELDEINFSLGTTITSSKLKSLEKTLIGLDNKQYTPRINKELFGV